MDDLTKHRLKRGEDELATGLSSMIDGMTDSLSTIDGSMIQAEILKLGCPPNACDFIGYPIGAMTCGVGSLANAGIAHEAIIALWDHLNADKEPQIVACGCQALTCPSHPRRLQQALRSIYDAFTELTLVFGESIAPGIATMTSDEQKAVVKDAEARALRVLQFYTRLMLKAGIGTLG